MEYLMLNNAQEKAAKKTVSWSYYPSMKRREQSQAIDRGSFYLHLQLSNPILQTDVSQSNELTLKKSTYSLEY